MLALFWLVLGLALVALVIAAGLSVHLRRRELVASDLPTLDDDSIHQILERGQLVIDEDEPLDLSEIEEQEERFWSESWDEPEEF